MARTRMADRLDEGESAAAPRSAKGRGRAAFVAEPVDGAGAGSPIEIPVELIDPAEDNPRRRIDLNSESMQELVASVKAIGVQVPVQVIARDGRYGLVYGHRRLAAAVAAGRATVPGVLAEVDDNGRQVRMIVENLHREDLNPMEEARALRRLQEVAGVKGQRALGKLVGVSQAHVSLRLRLLELPEAVQAKVEAKEISVGQAEALAKLKPAVAAKVVKEAAKVTWAGALDQGISRASREEEAAAAAAAQLAELRAAGVTILEDPGSWNQADGPVPLNWLHWVNWDEHAGAACHAATVGRGGLLTLVCVNPSAHPEPGAGERDERRSQREQEAAERQAAVEARSAARKARWDVACGLVRKGNPEAGAGLSVDMWSHAGWLQVQMDTEAVAEALGLKADTFNGRGADHAVRDFASKGTRNAQRAVYALAVVVGEDALDDVLQDRGGDVADFRRAFAYLRHLAHSGYEFGDVEHEALSTAKTVLAQMEAEDNEQGQAES